MNDRHDQLEAELLNMRRRMRRLAGLNALLAVVVLAFGGAGAAYALAAANSVNSASIIDGSILYADLKDASLGSKKIPRQVGDPFEDRGQRDRYNQGRRRITDPLRHRLHL